MNQQSNIVGPSAFSRRGALTRSQNNSNIMNITNNKQPDKDALGKRKADGSPVQAKTMNKRLAFGDLTNNTAGKSTAVLNAKKLLNSKVIKGSKVKRVVEKLTTKPPVKLAEIAPKQHIATKPLLVSTRKDTPDIIQYKNIAPRKTFVQFGKTSMPSTSTIVKIKAPTVVKVEVKKNPSPKCAVKVGLKTEIVSPAASSDSSTCLSSADNPLYVTAREVLSPADISRAIIGCLPLPTPLIPKVPANVDDFDCEGIRDQFQVSVYAMDIFNYLRERESKFVIGNYMEKQFCLTTMMRALLVDWMVEVQETFELNHETLYLAVKLVDLYLTKVTVVKETLQLIGAASIFIASKFDERIPPLVEDFLYICDGAYSHQELIRAEMNVVKVVEFDLGIPLSYRFLRRYARCAKVTMPILTLARFVLEYSLMDYSFVTCSDSKLAAACLLIALRMKKVSSWTPTLEYYTSYKMDDISPIMLRLNTMLHKEPKEELSTVRNKYSHKIFFEVAKVPLLSNAKLLNPQLPEKVVLF